MDFQASLVQNLKNVAKSGGDFFSGLVQRRQNASSRNPIEILKRLQREAFSDVMKLRDRQDKVERILSFHKTSKGGPFQEGGTRVRGEVDFLGALLLTDGTDLQNSDDCCRAGTDTGIMSRITFETKLRQSDKLEMELIASQQNQGYSNEILGSALSIAKICYTASLTDWLSLVAIPMGGRCRDVALQTSSSQDKGLTSYSSYGPPLLNSLNGGAVGLTARKSILTASLAQFDSSLGMYSNSVGCGNYLSTFGQIVCQLPKSTKLSLSGLHQVPKLKQARNMGALTIPLGIMKHRRSLDTFVETSVPPMEVRSLDTLVEPSIPPMEVSPESSSSGSVALMVESELDEYTRLKGWVQMKNSSPRCIKWAVGLSDSPEDEVGWGLNVGGMLQGPANRDHVHAEAFFANRDHVHAEAFLKLNLGNRFTLQPGLLCTMDRSNLMPAIMFSDSILSNNEEVHIYGKLDGNWEKIHVLQKHDQTVSIIDGSAKSNRIVTVSHVWNLESSECVPTLVILRHNQRAAP